MRCCRVLRAPRGMPGGRPTPERLVVTAAPIQEAVGEYILAPGLCNRHVFWLSADGTRCIFADIHGHWKLGRPSEMGQSIGDIKSQLLPANRTPEQIRDWVRVGDPEKGEDMWVPDRSVVIKTAEEAAADANRPLLPEGESGVERELAAVRDNLVRRQEEARRWHLANIERHNKERQKLRLRDHWLVRVAALVVVLKLALDQLLAVVVVRPGSLTEYVPLDPVPYPEKRPLPGPNFDERPVSSGRTSGMV
eukprot:TRINITY_DN44482_c0_g1_i1.p1 TRINITY_DN44482_c0_g1~~TRINITY_DN44482_c0_g1_i1.p1  ORF type:complete len:268 (+),score=75.77 TRINITY_DN44482_c0_g1_i1:55-804(+)